MSIQITRRRNDGGHASPDVVPFNNCFGPTRTPSTSAVLYTLVQNSDNQAGLACLEGDFRITHACAELTGEQSLLSWLPITVRSVLEDRDDVSESYTVPLASA